METSILFHRFKRHENLKTYYGAYISECVFKFLMKVYSLLYLCPRYEKP